MNILVLGPQGSGKGTQAKRIAERYGIPHVATGDMFRSAIAEGSELGRRVKETLDAGELVSDELTIALVRDRLGRDDATRGFVLDGYPRTLDQAAALDTTLATIGSDLDIVLFFELDDSTATARMLGRAREEGRDDDAPEVIARRLAIYHEQTTPVVERYRSTGKLVTLAAERSVDDVASDIVQALELVGVG